MSHHSQLAPSEMRDAPRKHVLMQATIISPEGPQRVFVKDLTLTALASNGSIRSRMAGT